MVVEVMGLITARGGSKGLPGKNVKKLGGKPLIAWSIDCSLASSMITRTVVSTDSIEISNAAVKYGAEVPFLRPDVLSGDKSSHIDTVIHALEWLRCEDGYNPDYLVLLQPTTPFRAAVDIDKAVSMMLRRNALSLVSVSPVDQHPRLMKTVDKSSFLRDYSERVIGDLPRQDLDEIYYINGALYVIKPSFLRSKKSWYSDETLAYLMPKSRAVDIDTEDDFAFAEFMAKTKFAEGSKT